MSLTSDRDGLINVVELDEAGVPVAVVQEHQQTRREQWRQVTDREVRVANGSAMLSHVHLLVSLTTAAASHVELLDDRGEWCADCCAAPPSCPIHALPTTQDHMSNRQDGPHAHCNVFHPSYRWLFVPDLGDNAIYQYGYDGGRITPQVGGPGSWGDEVRRRRRRAPAGVQCASASSAELPLVLLQPASGRCPRARCPLSPPPSREGGGPRKDDSPGGS